MARNRVIYQSEALYISKNINSTGSGEHAQLRRIQSANYSFSIDRKDVNQFGQLARIDALVLKSPTVNLDFSYYLTDGYNERALGFFVKTGTEASGNFASGQMGASSGQNYFIVTTDEGSDLNTNNGALALSGKTAISLGNGYLSNYTIDASVGNLPTAKVTIEALNMQSTAISGGSGSANVIASAGGTGNFVVTPVINPSLGTALGYTGQLPSPIESTGASIINALRPGDITISFSDYTTGGALSTPVASLTDMNVQSASLALPLSRTPIEKLGSRFAFARVVDFPIVATLNVSAVLSEIQSRNLASMLDDNTKRTITLTIKKPGSTNTDAMIFLFKGSQLKSESFSSSIGSNKTVDLVFETQIGGPTDTNNGIYVSGSSTEAIGTASTTTWGF